MKDKFEICGICQMKINLNKDNYCRLTDYLAGKFFKEGFFHIKCYIDKIKGGADLTKMKRMAFDTLTKARKMMGIEEPTEVVRIQ